MLGLNALIGPAELSLYSLCTVRARLGRCCVILIFFFSPSGSHFGATGGAFWGYMESPPGLLPFTVGAWGAFFALYGFSQRAA